MAKICLAFWSLCCIRVILGWTLRRGFVSKDKGDGENQESSEQGPPSTKAPRAPRAHHSHRIPGIIPALLERFPPSRTRYPRGGCSSHPSHPSPWFCNTAEGGRRGNPARSSRISLRPRAPRVQTPNHGQGWSTNRPEEFIISSRNKEPSTQLLLPLPLSPAAWTPFHGPRGSPGFPDSGARKEASQGLGGSSPHISPKGATEQTRRSFKDIPKSKYLKC